MTASTQTPRKGTLLIVDDEEIMREILDALLSREGYEVHLASDGTEGVELARSRSTRSARSPVTGPS